jgi:uncharacterized protein YkwD
MPTSRVVRRRRAIKAGLAILALGLAAAVAARIYLVRNDSGSAQPGAGLSAPEQEILDRVNRERARAGRRPLRASRRLAVVARGHSFDMAIRNYLAQRSPEGSGPAERVRGVGIAHDAVAENVYAEERPDRRGLAERAVLAWLGGAAERENLLSDHFTDSGVGVALAPNGRTYVTLDLIR